MSQPTRRFVNCFDYKHELLFHYDSIAEFATNYGEFSRGDLTQRIAKGMHSLKWGCYAWFPDGKNRDYECWFFGNQWQIHMAAKARAHEHKLKSGSSEYVNYMADYKRRNIVLGRDDFETIEGYIPVHLRLTPIKKHIVEWTMVDGYQAELLTFT